MTFNEQTARVEYQTGDLFESKAEAIVNAVNCVGVMGKSLALQFKKRFPDNFKMYQNACSIGELRPGTVLIHDNGKMASPRWIGNFPTKDHWRQPSKIDYIDSGLVALVSAIQQHKISSIAIPPLGCGLGGLNWADVRPRIFAALSPIRELTVAIYEPIDDSRAK